ncbi:hypothetical protein VKA52_17465 [Halobacillus sp. HZG1]|uniref:hypothetical protein n=1 Tax=Halobacillus sp. HZG1 TaxID=3111769 RepID=UPI002DB87A3F|nr:hypothetical protein [Halobacillus sp. HZG1]MEC3885511.1 hypothetical protein [Halobacillus sp. HZG1]
MPVTNSRLINPDPFVMNEDEVNVAVANFLKKSMFENVKYLSGNKTGIDVRGSKNGWAIFVESKGSQANKHEKTVVFDTNQIKTHTYMQICKLMEYDNEQHSNVILAMANPDIPRIRQRVQKVNSSLEKLQLLQIWVQKDYSVIIEASNTQRSVLNKLNLV